MPPPGASCASFSPISPASPIPPDASRPTDTPALTLHPHQGPTPLTIKSDINPAIRDRAHGALLGLAVGDALGTTLEFKRRDTYPRHTEMLGGGPFGLRPGEWTDDTATMLALAESLAAHSALDPRDLMDRFVAWYRRGEYSCTGTCFDIGIATRAALAQYERTGEPIAGSTAPDTAGNGSLMRLAPVALVTLDDPGEAERIAGDQSRTTHGAPQAVEACAYLVQLLCGAIRGEADVLRPRPWIGADTDGLRPRHFLSGMDNALMPVARDGEAAIDALARGSWRGKGRDEIRSSGYVVHTLEAALWAVGTTATFEDALVLAVNLGDDADTVGAVTGQLAGAAYGASAIPERWLAPLAWRARITDLADRLIRRDPEAAA